MRNIGVESYDSDIRKEENFLLRRKHVSCLAIPLNLLVSNINQRANAIFKKRNVQREMCKECAIYHPIGLRFKIH